MRGFRRLVAAMLATAAAALLAAGTVGAAPTVVAAGLDNPRGLTFGSDGTLYVAEAGRGGSGPCFMNSEPNLVCLGATGAITQSATGRRRGSRAACRRSQARAAAARPARTTSRCSATAA